MRRRHARNHYRADAGRLHRLANERGCSSPNPERSAVLQWLRVRPDRQYSNGYAGAVGCVYTDDVELFLEFCFVCPCGRAYG
jgi:hypothetical protein